MITLLLSLMAGLLVAWLARRIADHPEPEAPCGAPLAHRPRYAHRRRAQRWAPSARSRAEPRTGPPSGGSSTASTARTRLPFASTVAPSWARWARQLLAPHLTFHLNPSQHPIHSTMTG